MRTAPTTFTTSRTAATPTTTRSTLATTTDFVTYTEYDDPVLEASRSGGQDSWTGTGSVVKVGDKYYFFYTGHTDAATMEYAEKIMVAVGDSPMAFEKMEGWEITPPAELGQKRDFRDPQCYYDPATDTITMTVTAAQEGTARILKYTLSSDLQTVQYDGIIFTDPVGELLQPGVQRHLPASATPGT